MCVAIHVSKDLAETIIILAEISNPDIYRIRILRLVHLVTEIYVTALIKRIETKF